MADQEQLLRAFVELADTLVDDYDVVDFLYHLTLHCVELLDVSHAGVMLVNRDGHLRYVASSSERMRIVELLEVQEAEGPCFDALRTRSCHGSGTQDEADQRWPHFGPRAREAGIHAMTGIPLRLRDRVIGALNLFATRPGRLSHDDENIAQALADVATIGLLQERTIHERAVVTEQLEGALHSRVLIEQAKGIVAERRATSVDESFIFIRAYARAHNRKLTDVARDIIDGSLPTDLAFVESPPR